VKDDCLDIWTDGLDGFITSMYEMSYRCEVPDSFLQLSS